MKNIVKGIGVVLLVICIGLGKVAKVAEKSGNKATQNMEIVVNKASKVINEAAIKIPQKTNVQRGVIIGGSRAVHNATRSSAQTTTQPHWETCPGCQGDGKRMGEDGIIYVHQPCNGTGKIFIK